MHQKHTRNVKLRGRTNPAVHAAACSEGEPPHARRIEVDLNIKSGFFVDFGIPRPHIRGVLLRSVLGSNSGVSHVPVLAFSNSNILDGCK